MWCEPFNRTTIARAFSAALLAGATLLPAPATAALFYQLDATSSNVTLISDFSLTYNDLDADMLFSLDELSSFSGMMQFGTADPLTTITSVPEIAGFAVGGDDKWKFANDTSTVTANRVVWNYRIASIPNPVPLPAAAWLFGSALLGLGALKRKKA